MTLFREGRGCCRGCCCLPCPCRLQPRRERRFSSHAWRANPDTRLHGSVVLSLSSVQGVAYCAPSVAGCVALVSQASAPICLPSPETMARGPWESTRAASDHARPCGERRATCSLLLRPFVLDLPVDSLIYPRFLEPLELLRVDSTPRLSAQKDVRPWVLLDSRVVDLPRASNSTFVMLAFITGCKHLSSTLSILDMKHCQ